MAVSVRIYEVLGHLAIIIMIDLDVTATADEPTRHYVQGRRSAKCQDDQPFEGSIAAILLQLGTQHVPILIERRRVADDRHAFALAAPVIQPRCLESVSERPWIG